MSALKRPHTWIIAIIVIILIVLATRLLLTPRPATNQEGDSHKGKPSAASGNGVQGATGNQPITPIPVPEDLPPIVVHESAKEFSTMLSGDDKTAEDKLQAVREILYMYRQSFGGENPAGHNELVVSALVGENDKRTALLPNDSPAIKEGALVDQWGTPYWFHALSSKEMEVRSAGPDKELFTEDDLVLE